MSTWGDPSSPKHLLLIHGLTGASQTWHSIAQELALKGYFVTAPDLLGHGNARRGSVVTYTVDALAGELRPLFAAGSDHRYHAVIGQSIGGVVAAALLPLLKSTRSIPVILVDPPLEMNSELVAHYKTLASAKVRNPGTPDEFISEYPKWTEQDATLGSLSIRLCDVSAVGAIFDQNNPWSFTHLLSHAPPNTKVIVLAADPLMTPCVRKEDLKAYPHVTVETVRGASHMIPFEFPKVVIQTALQGMDGSWSSSL